MYHAGRGGVGGGIAYGMLVGRCDSKKPLGRLGHRWKCNIKMYFTEVGCSDVD